MATQILATAATAANSSDVTIAAGSTDAVFLKGLITATLAEPVRAPIQIKDSAGAYHTIGYLTNDEQGVILYGPATYRVARLGGATFGVESGS
jgi:hypothetical protein